MSDSERRQFKRINFIANVLLQHNDNHWTCELIDISLKGLLIKAPADVEPQLGELYAIDLVLGVGTNIIMHAYINHIDAGLWAMVWKNIDVDCITHLRKLLELNSADPSEIHREISELGL